jgi:hypothetical protein
LFASFLFKYELYFGQTQWETFFAFFDMTVGIFEEERRKIFPNGGEFLKSELDFLISGFIRVFLGFNFYFERGENNLYNE